MNRPLARTAVLLIALPAALLATVWLDAPPRDPEPVPKEYAGLERPATTMAPGEVAALFHSTCAPCHGMEGKGDGRAGANLDPKPAAFREEGFLAGRSDPYLFWRLTEGKPTTSMPEFNSSLSPEKRWALISYIRAQWGADS